MDMVFKLKGCMEDSHNLVLIMYEFIGYKVESNSSFRGY